MENKEDEMSEEIQKFIVTSEPLSTKYEVNIDETFEHTSQFSDVVFILEKAVAGDQVKLNLSSNGGSLAAVIPMLNAMKNSAAQVDVHIVSDIGSACTFIPMYADSVEINDYATVMCHNVYYGTEGTGHTVKDYVEYTTKATETLLREVYFGFFTEDEINMMLSGKEFWMGKEEFITRYENMSTIREDALIEALKAEGVSSEEMEMFLQQMNR